MTAGALVLSETDLRQRRDQTTWTLARNIRYARVAAGVTQAELANAASVSRATVNAIESGEADPRLSTVAGIAAALSLSPMLLMMGEEEMEALHGLTNELAHPDRIDQDDVEEMQRLLASGIRRKRLKAAALGAAAGTAAVGGAAGVAAGAAIGSAIAPGIGTIIGGLLGSFIAAGATASAVADDEEPPRDHE